MALLRIADGFNNTEELQSFRELNPPMFRIYRHPLTEWHDSVGQRVSGDGKLLNVGRPWVAWFLKQLFPAEMTWFLDNFGDEVTIETYNKRANSMLVYNAIFWRPNLGNDENAIWMESRGRWEDIRFVFRDLELIPE